MDRERVKKVILKILVKAVIFLIAAATVIALGIRFMGGEFVLLIMPLAITDLGWRGFMMCLRELRTSICLNKNGVPVRGKVVERTKDAHIEYTVDGRKYRHSFGWSQGTFKVGDEAELLYSADDPQKVIVKWYEHTENLLLTAVFALFFAGSAAGTAYLFLALADVI